METKPEWWRGPAEYLKVILVLNKSLKVKFWSLKSSNCCATSSYRTPRCIFVDPGWSSPLRATTPHIHTGGDPSCGWQSWGTWTQQETGCSKRQGTTPLPRLFLMVMLFELEELWMTHFILMWFDLGWKPGILDTLGNESFWWLENLDILNSNTFQWPGNLEMRKKILSRTRDLEVCRSTSLEDLRTWTYWKQSILVTSEPGNIKHEPLWWPGNRETCFPHRLLAKV